MCCRLPKLSVGKLGVWLNEDDFGSFKDSSGESRNVRRFTWENVRNTKIQVINYGATITSIQVSDKDGKVEDIVTGFNTIEEYLSKKNKSYYGATIGRVANRTAKGEMTVEGVDYKLAANNGPNHLHGGIQGFDKVLWNHRVDGTKLILTYHSKDMEEGYPGDLIATVTMQLTVTNQFQIEYKAVVSKTTPVNLTNHTYFNLAGHGSGSEGLYQHEITINADRYTEVDSTAIPTGNLPNVSGTIFDLRLPKLLADVIHKVPNSPGYDHNFCITKPKSSPKEVTFVAKALHKPSGRIMEVYTDQPGVQFYTGNFISDSEGKGVQYVKHGAFCLETQIYPDAIHHANFPEVLVYPGQEYYHFTSFNFMIQE